MSEQVIESKLVKRFEDLKVWQEARGLAGSIYQVTKNPRFASDFDLTRQIRRAAVSVMANISEGFGRLTVKDRRQFLITSRGSLTELQSHLYIALDQGYLTEIDFRKTMEHSILVSKLLNGLIGYLNSNNERMNK